MFKALEHMFQAFGQVFTDLEHMFQALEHKFSLGVNYFSPRDKLKFVKKKIKFFLHFSKLNCTFAHVKISANYDKFDKIAVYCNIFCCIFVSRS